MFIDDKTRLCHMLESAKQATAFIEGQNRQELEDNAMLSLAILRCLEVIGEAASRITRERQDALPQIPWAQIIAMRNRLVHAYYDIKFDIVWSTVTQDLPPLIQELEAIVNREEQDG